LVHFHKLDKGEMDLEKKIQMVQDSLQLEKEMMWQQPPRNWEEPVEILLKSSGLSQRFQHGFWGEHLRV
jgi:hypothetical protein